MVSFSVQFLVLPMICTFHSLLFSKGYSTVLAWEGEVGRLMLALAFTHLSFIVRNSAQAAVLGNRASEDVASEDQSNLRP